MAQVGILAPTTGTIVNSSQMESGAGNADYYRLIPGGSGAGTNAGQWRVGSFFIAGVSEGQRGTTGFGNEIVNGFGNPYGRSGISGWGAYNVSGSDQFGSLCYFRFASTGVGAYGSNLINNRTAVSNGQRWSLVSSSNSAPGFPSVISGSITPGATIISPAFPSGDTTSDGVTWETPSTTHQVVIYINTRDNRGGTPGGLTPGGGRAAIFSDKDNANEDHSGFSVGGGGDGLDIKDAGSGSSGNPFKAGSSGFDGSYSSSFTLNNFNANGGNYGGGGGFFTDWYDSYNISYGGYGGAGRVWFTYVRPTATGLTQIPTVVTRGATYTIQVQSYWDGTFNGQFTVPTNASTGVQPFYISDSRGARIAFFANVAVPPTINSFTAQDQFNTNGVPTDDVTFSWELTDVSGVPFTIEIYRGSIDPLNLIYSSTPPNASSGFALLVSTGLQSVVGTNSPATDTFILKVTITGGFYNSASTTGRVYNDNTPSNTTVSNLALPGNLLRSSLEPSPPKYRSTVSFSGTDMPVVITVSGDGNEVSADNLTWSSSLTLGTAQTEFSIRYDSLPFNTSTIPTGTNVLGEAIGSTNTKTINFSVGTYAGSFDVTTRAPVIEETFSTVANPSNYPYPDIDTVPPEPITENYTYISGISLDDIEIPVEIKTNLPDAQVNINSSGWEDMGEI